MEILNKITHELSHQNVKKIKWLIIFFLVLGVFNLVVDYSGSSPWNPKMIPFYKTIDWIFTCFSILVAIYFWLVKTNSFKIDQIMLKITVLIVIVWSVLICGIDYSATGFSTFIAPLLLILLYLNFNPSFFIPLIWVSTSALIVIMLQSPNSRGYVESTIYTLLPINIVASFISVRFYREKIKALTIYFNNEDLQKHLIEAQKSLKTEVDRKTKKLKKANKELEENREHIKIEKDRFEALIQKLHQGVLYMDTEGNILEVNESTLKILGSPSKKATKSINIIEYEPLKNYGFTQRYLKCIKKHKTTSGNGYYTSKWGNQRFLEYYFVPITQRRKIIGVLACVEDFTERHEIQKDLIKAKEKAEESDRLKSAFLANTSHEIRTPMNGILGFANLLLDDDLNKNDQASYIKIINSAGERLLNTINDIIDISKIDSHGINVVNDEVNVSEMINSLVDFFEIQCHEKEIHLSADKSCFDPPIIIHSDKSKLNSVFTNIIKNAIKFTDSGSIKIQVNEQSKSFTFFIKDTGIGIAKDRQKAIFERFIQADIEDKNARQGSGLGLAIAKSYVEMLGGTIGLNSEMHKGSTFYFTIPKDTDK